MRAKRWAKEISDATTYGPGGTRFTPLVRNLLVDRLLSNPTQVKLLVAAPGYGKTIVMHQAADRWRGNGIVHWISCPLADDTDSLSILAGGMGSDDLVCLDAPDGLSSRQVKAVAAFLLRRTRPSVMISTHDRSLMSQLPCEYDVFDSEALRFSEVEIATFLRGRDDLPLEIIESSQGWPFALDMMRQAPKRSNGQGMFDLGRDVPQIAEFFDEHVVPRLSEPMLNILSTLALLDSNFSIDLVNWVTEDPEAWQKLQPAISAQLFIWRVHERSEIYRLHPMFGQFLRDVSQKAACPDATRVLRRASEWFRREGRWDRAIRYAAMAHDSLAIVQIAQQAGGWKMLGGGGMQSVGAALDSLPDGLMLTDPQARAFRALSALKAGRGCDGVLDPKDSLLGFVADFYQDKLAEEDWLTRLHRLREDVGTADCVSFGLLSSLICLRHLDEGALSECESEARRAIDVFLGADHSSGTAYLHAYRARVEAIRGNLDSADAHVGRISAIAWEPMVGVEPLAQLASVHAATIALERGDLEAGHRLMVAGWPFLASIDGWYDVFAEAIATSVRLMLGQGEIPEALDILDQGDVIADRRSLPRLQQAIAAWRMVVAVTSRDVAAVSSARRRIDELRSDRAGRRGDDGHFLTEALAFAEASYALWRGSAEVAFTLLICESQRADAIGALPLRRRAQMGAALAAFAHGRRSVAEELINHALTDLTGLETIEGLLPTFGDLRPLLRDMVRTGRVNDPRGAELIQALESTRPVTADHARISIREEQILDLIAEGMTNKEIADNLSISDSTVKFHLKNIYTRFGINRRSSALEILKKLRAKDARIIPWPTITGPHEG